MKRSFFLVLAIVITACSTTPPQVTVTSEVTVTLLPASPTPEPTTAPEPTLSPEMAALQISLEETNYGLTANEDGTVGITYTVPETNEKRVIEQITFDKTGKMTVTVDDNTFEADPTTLEIVEGDIYFKDTAIGIGWKFSEKTKLLYPEIDKKFDYSSLSDPERFHNVDFDTAIYDPEFDAHLITLLETGRFPEMSPEVVPFERVQAYEGRQAQLNLYGSAPMIAIPTEIALEYRYGSKEKVPVQLVHC